MFQQLAALIEQKSDITQAQMNKIQEVNIMQFVDIKNNILDIQEDNRRTRQELTKQIKQVEQQCYNKHQGIQAEVKEQGNRIHSVEQQVSQEKREKEEFQKQVNNQISEVRITIEQVEQANYSGGHIFEGRREKKIPEEMKFGGRSDKPLLFLKEMKASLGKIILKWELAKENIKMYLIGPAREWYMLHIDSFNNFEEFENKFKLQYWSVIIQSNLRRKIENGRYDPRSQLTANEYLTSQRLLSTQFTCFDDELQFVMMVSRHFNHRIQEAQINGGITTIQRLSDILEAYSAREEFRPNYSNVSFQNNSQRGFQNSRQQDNRGTNQNVNPPFNPNNSTFRNNNNNLNINNRSNPNNSQPQGRRPPFDQTKN